MRGTHTLHKASIFYNSMFLCLDMLFFQRGKWCTADSVRRCYIKMILTFKVRRALHTHNPRFQAFLPKNAIMHYLLIAQEL